MAVTWQVDIILFPWVNLHNGNAIGATSYKLVRLRAILKLIGLSD